jgi:hypothetical protein
LCPISGKLARAIHRLAWAKFSTVKKNMSLRVCNLDKKSACQYDEGTYKREALQDSLAVNV